jgi:hypothetical protein
MVVSTNKYCVKQKNSPLEDIDLNIEREIRLYNWCPIIRVLFYITFFIHKSTVQSISSYHAQYNGQDFIGEQVGPGACYIADYTDLQWTWEGTLVYLILSVKRHFLDNLIIGGQPPLPKRGEGPPRDSPGRLC